MPLRPPFSEQRWFCLKKKRKALRRALTSHSAELKRSHKYHGIDREEMKSQRCLSEHLAAHGEVLVPRVLPQLDEPSTRSTSVTRSPTLTFMLGCK